VLISQTPHFAGEARSFFFNSGLMEEAGGA